MRALTLAIVLATGVAQAEVIECPAKHNSARLIGAGIYEGEQKEAELMGSVKKVPSGINADFGFNRGDVRWLACTYEPKAVRWFRLDPTTVRCELRTREASNKVTAAVRCTK